MSYKPPIQLDLEWESPTDKLVKEIIDEQDHYIYREIMKVSNIQVDEERLKHALAFDKGQYDYGYREGYDARDKEIVRCKDCEYYTHYKWIDIVTHEAIEGYRCDKDIISNTIDVNPNDFCSYGERMKKE